MFRTNYWYLNIYVLWLNTLLNIFLPILSLVILNIIILRQILLCEKANINSSLNFSSERLSST